MATRFQSVEELVARLQAEGVRQVILTGKVATATSPGGKQITFRGRLIVSGDLAAGGRAEYVEQVKRYATEVAPPEVPVSPERATDLQRSQMALMLQLRAYRSEYQAVMKAARSSLTGKLVQAGIAVVEPPD